MSQASNNSRSVSPAPTPTGLAVTFSVTLTPGKPIKTGKAATKSAAQAKAKTKELTFSIADDEKNYIEFLKAILDKFGESDAKALVSAGSPYPLQFWCPPVRTKTDALDIEDYDEYCEMITTIDANIKGLKKINLGINMDDVVKALDKGEKGDEDGEVLPTKLGKAQQLSHSEYERARIRILIENKYRKQGDNSSVFTYSDGASIILTPHLLGIWANHIYDAKCTSDMPPNLPEFLPANHKTQLKDRFNVNSPNTATIVPSPSAATVSASPSPPQSELAHVATIVSSLARLVPASQSHPTEPPRTPSRPRAKSDAPAPSPVVPITPHPSHITDYLTYAENKLGVKHATIYNLPLCEKGFGPDILAIVPDEALTAIGITHGDALRLKRASDAWWKTSAKRKRSVVDGDAGGGASGNDIDTNKPMKQICYQRLPADGGGITYGGPPMARGRRSTEDDETKYYNEATDSWLPIPPGYKAPGYSRPDWAEPDDEF